MTMQATRHSLAQLVAGEQLAHRIDQLVFLDRELRFGLLLEVFVAVLDVARRRARRSGP